MGVSARHLLALNESEALIKLHMCDSFGRRGGSSFLLLLLGRKHLAPPAGSIVARRRELIHLLTAAFCHFFEFRFVFCFSFLFNREVCNNANDM